MPLKNLRVTLRELVIYILLSNPDSSAEASPHYLMLKKCSEDTKTYYRQRIGEDTNWRDTGQGGTEERIL